MTWLGLHWIDWIVVATYLIGVTLLGVLAARKVSDMTDFFMGGRRFGKVFMMFFAFGAGTSSEQANSVVAGAWRAGLAGIWWQLLWLFSTPFYWLIAPVMRRMRALTTSDFFEARFNRSTATLYSIWGIIIAVVFIAGALYGSGKMIDALTGGELSRVARESKQLQAMQFVPVIQRTAVPADAGDAALLVRTTLTWRSIHGYEIAILCITVLFVTYGMAGGLGAAVWTDFIQGILTIVFSIMLLPFVFGKIGGFAMLNPPGVEPIKPDMFDLVASERVAELLGKEPITVFYVFMLSVIALTGIVVQPHIMGVCGAGKTEFEGRFGFTFGNFIKRFCTIAWTFTALACVIWYLGADSPLLEADGKSLQQHADDSQLYSDLKERIGPDFEALSEVRKQELSRIDGEFADRLFGRAAHDILPGVMPGLVGLLLASLLAAMMSTCDAQMIVASGLFTENIYRRSFRPRASQRHYLWVGRIAALLIVLLALLMQTTFVDVIDALKVIIKTPAIIGISLWMGITWRGWTPAAVWVSSAAGSAVWALCTFWPELVTGTPALAFMTRTTSAGVIIGDAWVGVLLLSSGLLAGLVTSLLTPRTPTDKLDYFFRLMRTPVQPGEDIDEPCTLPENPSRPLDKLINHPDIEIPKPTRADILGFVAAWICVGGIIALVRWLAG